MRFGMCGNWDKAGLFRKEGFDYYEISVGELCCPREGEEVFAERLRKAQAAPLPVAVANCFVPGDLKITGPAVDAAALHAFAATAVARAARAGVKIIVFGSGDARRIPDGFDRAAAWRQLVAFGKDVAQLAAAAGVTIAVEPLNSADCNVITTVAEGADYVRAVGDPAVRLLVDSYHWGKDGGTEQEIRDAASLLCHVHVATWPSRRVPGFEDCGLDRFLALLRSLGYDGGVSFEGNLPDGDAELAGVAARLRQWAGV